MYLYILSLYVIRQGRLPGHDGRCRAPWLVYKHTENKCKQKSLLALSAHAGRNTLSCVPNPGLAHQPPGHVSSPPLHVTDLDLSDFARFQKSVKFRARLLKDLRGRFRKAYLELLVQKAHKTTRVLIVGEIVLIENPNKKRLYWPLGKFIELIPGRDGKVRSLKLRCSNSEIICLIQRVLPLETQSAEMGESNDVPLDSEALKIPSGSVDVSESAMIPVNAPLNMSKVSRYGCTIQRPRRLIVFNGTTVLKSE
ncbi:DUF5641 domain-containing protein [Trichonephila clavipes]|nr:DUF5641 domain-containing protein [Trichonephila clavipes]